MKYTAMKWMTMVAMALLVNLGHASSEPTKEDGQILRAQILEHLADPDLRNSGVRKESAVVHIQVNAKGEMVVVQVDTESDFVDQFLKGRLNYQKIENEVSIGRYVIKITVQDGSTL